VAGLWEAILREALSRVGGMGGIILNLRREGVAVMEAESS
jgi:hypothetical protein